jgi:hypothetical protein
MKISSCNFMHLEKWTLPKKMGLLVLYKTFLLNSLWPKVAEMRNQYTSMKKLNFYQASIDHYRPSWLLFSFKVMQRHCLLFYRHPIWICSQCTLNRRLKTCVIVRFYEKKIIQLPENETGTTFRATNLSYAVPS